MEKIIKKWTATWIAITFIWMVIGIISPGQLKAGTTKAENTASTAETAKSDISENNSFEKEGTTPEIIKKKKFPWLWVAAGVVAAGVIVYFTLIKKPRYDLTVEVGTGVIGTPAAGKYTYKKGKETAYNFTCADGYKNLTILLDGEIAAASGAIVMNRAHSLKVTAIPLAEYALTVNVDNGISGTPATGIYKYREGTAVSYHYAAADPALAVSLDDIVVPNSGSFVMDRDHLLKVQIAYTLIINLESGIIGTPAAGTYQYKKGASVPYQYSIAQGIPFVKLDDIPVPASGSLKMNSNHVLKVSRGQLPDIRGEWRIIMNGEKSDLDVLFSGERANGQVDLLKDPDKYWYNFGMMIGRIGIYEISASRVSILITEHDSCCFSDISLSGYFLSTDTMMGTYEYDFSDPPISINGTWTAVRIE